MEIKIAASFAGGDNSSLHLGGGHFGGAHGVLQEQGDGHGPNAAGVGSDFSGNGLDPVKINVAHQAASPRGGGIGHAVDSNVNHDRARLDHAGFDKMRGADGRD
jgi:hypothetical protein